MDYFKIDSNGEVFCSNCYDEVEGVLVSVIDRPELSCDRCGYEYGD